MKTYERVMQCNSGTLHQLFKLSASRPNSCLQSKSPLINCLINLPLLNARSTVNQILPHIVDILNKLLISQLS